MAWIKIDHVTPDKPEIASIAQDLGIDHDAAFGKCIRIWIWADQQSISGDAINVTENFLDRLACHPGFAKSLEKVGWLKVKKGGFSLPHFDRHNGQSAKNRALTADRMRKSRDAISVTDSSPDQIRLEKEKDQIKKIKKEKREDVAPLRGDPLFLRPDFCLAWDEWQKSRKGKLKLTDHALALNLAELKRLAGDDVGIAIQIVNQTIRNAWKGFFPLKDESHGKNIGASQRGTFGPQSGGGSAAANRRAEKSSGEYPETLTL